MQDLVTLTHRNVCKDGFTVENLADAGMYDGCYQMVIEQTLSVIVFLDLPAPWDAVMHAKKALRVILAPPLTSLRLTSVQKDRPTRICCFSPCMEQVIRAVSALNEAGFTGSHLSDGPRAYAKFLNFLAYRHHNV